jgi:hypothetical protein
MDFPGSPYHVLERLLEEYRSGQRTPEDVARSLDIFDLFVEQWSEGMMAVPVEPEVLPEGKETIDESMAGLECFSEASAVMRDFLSTGTTSWPTRLWTSQNKDTTPWRNCSWRPRAKWKTCKTKWAKARFSVRKDPRNSGGLFILLHVAQESR